MKRIFSLAGIGVGLFAIIVSFCLFAGLGKGNWSVSSSPYDSGFASFGADYYTYSVNNSAEAASAARAAAHNVSGLCEVVEVCSAWAIFFLGLIAICAFGIVFASTLPPKEDKIAIVEVDECDVLSVAGSDDENVEEVMEETSTEIEENQSEGTEENSTTLE